MPKLIHSLLLSLAGAFALALAVVLNLALAPVLGFSLLALDLVLLVSALTIATYLGEFSLPGVNTLLKREYYRIKFKIDKCKKDRKMPSIFPLAYLKFLAQLTLLFKTAEEGFEVIREEAEEFHGQALLFISAEKKKGGKLLDQLFRVHKTKKRRATVLSATAVFLLIAGSLVTSIFSTLMYPNIFQSSAATYTWTQTDWSGGVSASVAQHSDGSPEQNWIYYKSKDDNINIDGSGNITMSSGSQDTEYDTTTDFAQGSYPTNKYFTSISIESGKLELQGGYYADGVGCGDFYVAKMNLTSTYDWSGAKTTCNNLCENCALPTKIELRCLCNNQSYFGNNFAENEKHWSITDEGCSGFPCVVLMRDDCWSGGSGESNNHYVRCVRR